MCTAVLKLNRILIFALGLALATIPGVGLTRGEHRSAEASEPGQFDYYLLTLSWSPAHCAAHPDDRAQCGSRRFHFVVHGLWPQFSAGGFPASCTNESLQPEVVDRAMTFMPSRKLIQHEWEKHGTCSGMDSVGYFDAAERALAGINIPSTFASLGVGENLHITADEVVEMFKTANQDLDDGMIVVKCSGKELEEVRVCLDKDLHFTACGKGVRTQCVKSRVLVRPVR
jgi:ribonuclease T2